MSIRGILAPTETSAMLRDSPLIPSEAIRLAALGMLAEKPAAYGAVAREVRHFTSRLVGPSLDLMGSSLELLRHEGLVERSSGETTGLTSPETELRITDAGRLEFEALLQAPLKAPINDFGRFVIALKLMYLHRLPKPAQLEQIDLLIELYEGEAARLSDLRTHHNPGQLGPWLDHEVTQANERLAWFRGFRERLPD
jgi:DNA-binding PadR family transcriptional regulator